MASPYLHEGQAPPHTFALNGAIRGGVPLAKLASPSHDIQVNYTSPEVAQVTLKDDKTGATGIFVLRYALAGDKIDAGLLLYPGQDENFFLMVISRRNGSKKRRPRPGEYIFIVDVSGSMNGYPLETSKALMKDIITGLRPQDFMNILLFESGSQVLSQDGVPPPATVDRRSGPGVHSVPAGKAARRSCRPSNGPWPCPGARGLPASSWWLPTVMSTWRLKLFELIRQNLGEANLFPFGIGTSVNRFLIEGMARAGRGEPLVIEKEGQAAAEAARFQRYIETPVLTNIKVAFPGFEAYDVEPSALPDLFALLPADPPGEIPGTPQGAVVITGQTVGRGHSSGAQGGRRPRPVRITPP